MPWNYPLIITAWKLGAALATGNSVVLKPASQSPLTALRLAELAAEAGLPDGVLNVVPGPGAVIGDALARHPGVDKIAFTGSTEVGRSLLRAVGETDVKAISLELGGKSPQVVLADVGDLEAAADADRLGDLLQQRPDLQRRLAAHRPPQRPRGAGRADRGHGPASWRRASRSTRRRGSARSSTSGSSTRSSATSRSGGEEGARVVAGGERVREETGGFYVAPTILDGVDNGWRVAREEIFGPVLTVTEFEDEADALRHRQRHAVRPGGRDLDPRRQPRPPAGAVDPGRASCGSTPSTRPTSPCRSAASSSRGSGATRALPALDGYTQLKTTWFDLSGK